MKRSYTKILYLANRYLPFLASSVMIPSKEVVQGDGDIRLNIPTAFLIVDNIEEVRNWWLDSGDVTHKKQWPLDLYSCIVCPNLCVHLPMYRPLILPHSLPFTVLVTFQFIAAESNFIVSTCFSGVHKPPLQMFSFSVPTRSYKVEDLRLPSFYR